MQQAVEAGGDGRLAVEVFSHLPQGDYQLSDGAQTARQVTGMYRRTAAFSGGVPIGNGENTDREVCV